MTRPNLGHGQEAMNHWMVTTYKVKHIRRWVLKVNRERKNWEVARGLGWRRDLRRLARQKLGFLTWVSPFIQHGENEQTARIR
jgi:hypothetical protein